MGGGLDRRLEHDVVTKPRLLVVGAGGQVGHEIELAPEAAGFELVALARRELDIVERDAVFAAMRRLGPDAVVNCAGFTAVDRAESESDAAFSANAQGAANLAEACREHGAPLVQLSTDYVFDGRKAGPYREDDAVAPLNVYGASKAAGEAVVRAAGGRYAILRTSWVYGPHGHNFVRTMLRLARERDKLAVVDDQRGAPTASIDVARAILAVIAAFLLERREVSGIYHFAARGETTWFGFAREIFAAAAACGLAIPRLEPIASADYPSAARRPPNSVLDCTRFERTFALARRPWQDGIPALVAALLAEVDA